MRKENLLIKEILNLGIRHQQKGNFEEAKKNYQEILKIDHDHVAATNNLGLVFIELKDYREAKIFLEKVIQINPKHEKAHNNLGLALRELGDYQKAKECHEKAIQLDPNYEKAHFNLGLLFEKLKEFKKAQSCYEKVIQIDPKLAPAHHNLGVILKKLGELEKAKECYGKATQINPNFVEAHYALGEIFFLLNEHQKAKDCYEKVVQIDPYHLDAHNYIGITLLKLGKIENAKKCFEKAIKINPNYEKTYNNLGCLFNVSADNKKAKGYFLKAIEVNPNFGDAYWNLHSLCSNIDDALVVLNKLNKVDKNHIPGKIMKSALEVYKGDFTNKKVLEDPAYNNNALIRSIKWVFSLPHLPKIYFDTWDFLDAILLLVDKSRPFYEFGVWNGISFNYLIKKLKKGFGFDTFSGLPEKWYQVPAGSYSSFGSIPKIANGEFIVGKFEDTLSKFFSVKRPMASLINFDADLYSSTICALNNAKNVIDDETILVFDEFLLNSTWEQDEFKALEEFCNNFNYNYNVIAFSFMSKQVAVKLNKVS